MGSEAEGVGFQLDTVRVTSTHGKGHGTSLFNRGWILFHSGVADSERQRAGIAILVAQGLYIGIYPGEREGSLPPPSGGGRHGRSLVRPWRLNNGQLRQGCRQPSGISGRRSSALSTLCTVGMV